MKNLYLLLLIPFLMLTGFDTRKVPLKIGSFIPKANVKMENYGGVMISLHNAGKENGLLVIFNSNTCPTVVQSHTRIMDAANFAIKNKVGVIMLNSNEANRDGSDSKQIMRTYAEELGYKWCYVIDKNSMMANEFGARFTPECYLFDKLGRLIYRGAVDDSSQVENAVTRSHVQEAIKENLSGRKVSVPETEPAGCAIKRK